MSAKTETTKETKMNQAQGLTSNLQVFLSQDKESLVHKLPGSNMKIELHVNFYKKVLGVEFTPKVQSSEKTEMLTRSKVYGFVARPEVFLDRTGEYLIHKVLDLKIVKPVNFYKAVLGIPFERKAKAS